MAGSVEPPGSQDAARGAGLFLVLLAVVIPAKGLLNIAFAAPGQWFAMDWCFRLAVLGLVFAVPVFRRPLCRRGNFPPDAVAFAIYCVVIALLVLGYEPIVQSISRAIDHAWPQLRAFAYPAYPSAAIRLADLTIGLALVAVSEELLFRKLARAMLAPVLGERLALILVSGVLFGALHWSSGAGSVIGAMLFGFVLMYLYLDFDDIALPIAAHYLVDLALFRNAPIAG